MQGEVVRICRPLRLYGRSQHGRKVPPQLDLQDHLSRRVQGPYLGYLQAQKQRLTGERGQKRIHRPGLEEMYGFDTKYATHMLRLGFQGVELLTTGRLSLPMREPERSYLLDVRRGKVSEQDCLTRAGELERELAELEATSALPEAPAEGQVEEWYRMRIVAAGASNPMARSTGRRPTMHGAMVRPERRLAALARENDQAARSVHESGRPITTDRPACEIERSRNQSRSYFTSNAAMIGRWSDGMMPALSRVSNTCIDLRIDCVAPLEYQT